MMIARTFTAVAVFAGALCKPIAGVCQTTVSLGEVQSANVSSAAPIIDTARRLDGRLFFSAAERQRMDQVRKRGLVVNDEGNFVEAPPNILNGFVKRSDGNAVVWVDGEVRWNAQTQNAQSLVPSNVGGPAIYLKSTTAEPQTALPKPNAPAKKAVKPRVRKIPSPRLLPL